MSHVMVIDIIMIFLQITSVEKTHRPILIILVRVSATTSGWILPFPRSLVLAVSYGFLRRGTAQKLGT
jgi:hypothetical protein